MGSPLTDRREIAARIVKGLSSPVTAVIFDSRLVNVNEVDALIKEAGVDVVLRKWRKDNVIVYYVDLKRVWRKCEVEECVEVAEEPERTRCIKKCFWISLEGLVSGVAKSLEEVLS